MQSNILKETKLYEYEYDCNHVKVVKTCRRNSDTWQRYKQNIPRQPGMNETKPNKIVKNSYEVN